MGEQPSPSMADRLIWWIIGIMATMLMAGLWAWVADNTARYNKIQLQVDQLYIRVSTIDRTQQIIQERQDDVRRRLKRLETGFEDISKRLWWIEYQSGLSPKSKPYSEVE